jgi:hypothetical protein
LSKTASRILQDLKFWSSTKNIIPGLYLKNINGDPLVVLPNAQNKTKCNQLHESRVDLLLRVVAKIFLIKIPGERFHQTTSSRRWILWRII